MIRWVKSKLSMKLVLYDYFTDVVSGDIVSVYEDCYGTAYMASSKYGPRVRMKDRGLEEREW